MKVIINADDCGYEIKVTMHIKNAIEKGMISSTTIITNKDDFEGAVSLYQQYKGNISFGCHLNLTEGRPLINNRLLVDYGYYKEDENGDATFDCMTAKRYQYKVLPRTVKKALFEELAAQINKLREAGVEISHIDSHHHIHTSPCLFDVIAQLSKEFHIAKIRRLRNYVPGVIDFWCRQTWAWIAELKNREYQMTDLFAGVGDYAANPFLRRIGEDKTLELMAHLGHKSLQYQTEEKLLESLDYNNIKLINYHDL